MNTVVYVKIPQSVLKTQPFLREYDGKTMKVSKMRVIANQNWNTYYELEGAVGKNEMPFSFMRDWVEPV